MKDTRKPEQVYSDLFKDLKKNLSLLDPVAFAENYLTIDGRPFDMTGNGWKFMADVYRDVAAQATGKNAKPIVILKGRQIGATVLAAVLSLYFTASGIYGAARGTPPMRIMHAFPTIGIMSKYARDKLMTIIQDSQDNFISNRSIKMDPIHGKSAPDDTLTEKTFIGFNKLRIDSLGRDASRTRGLSMDGIFLDECFPFEQHIEVEGGSRKRKIGSLYNDFIKGIPLPRVMSYNEEKDVFEYKRILNAWKRDPKPLLQIKTGRRKFFCTANHPFLTTRGWVRASELTSDDLLKVRATTPQWPNSLNDDQYQVVLGSFLGDGHLSSHKPGRYRIAETHCIAQKDYCEWKASIFNSKITHIEKNGYAQTPAVRFASTSFGFRKVPKTKTSCPQWILDDLDERGLAIWFMDDGSSNRARWGARFSTCSFDEDTQIRIVEKLKKFGIESRYTKYRGEFYIILKTKAFAKLSEIIAPYVHKNIDYKINKKYRTDNKYIWNNKYNTCGLSPVDDVSWTSRVEEVYDIEVEDNHNFIPTSTRTTRNIGGPIAHNCQDLSQEAVENSLRILTSAQYGPPMKGIQLSFGTPKNTGSYFYSIWEASDQRFYQLKCPDCEEGFFLYTYGNNEWREIMVGGTTLKCPKCGHIHDKVEAIEGGKWVPTRNIDPRTQEPPKYVGYHMNVLLNPKYTKEDILDYDPSVNPSRSEKAWKNETLGEFYSGGADTLTWEELQQHALDPSRDLSAGLKADSDKITVMGIDWGGKDFNDGSEGANTMGKSYTALSVLSVARNGTFTIENAWRLPRNDFDYKVEVIQELFRRYKISAAAADWFYGQDVVTHMQSALNYGPKFLGCINSGTLASTISYKPKELRVVLNKDMMIEDIFSLVRQGKLKFPVKSQESFEQIRWLMRHLTSMEVRVKNRNGNFIKTYDKGSTPNDGLMAVLYAIIAYRFISTNGFKSVQNVKKSGGPPAPVLGYVPGLR